MIDLHNSYWPGWETTRLIGRGSFGAVYEIQRKLFEDDDEAEKAALKVISIPQNDSDIEEMYSDGYDEESVTSTFHTHLKSIVAEYSLMRKMNGSSNIVNCDDVRYVQHDDGIGWDIYIKMELLTPLAKALPAAVSEEQVIKIAKDMCAALELCGKHNIVHRDIKPQNIFVSENGDYKLGDFGIAKTVEKTMGGTKTGTYKYMAPEVYSNRPYNSTADIYSTGLVLYWLLNERRMPFMPLPPEKLKAGMDEESRSRRFAGEKIPAPKNGSKELQEIVLKACAFDPTQRYQSAAEMLADLQTVQSEFVPVCLPETDMVHAKSNADEEKTIGPVFGKTDPETELDVEKTVGSQFDKVEETDQLDNEKTVGPVFVAADKPKQPKKKKRVWPIIAVLLLAVALGGVFAFTRTVVVSVALNQNVLENHLLDGYSAIGYYDVNTKLPIGSTRKVEIEVGEVYNNQVVLITGDTVEQPIAVTVIGGKVSAELDPKGTYLLQVETDTTSDANWSGWETKLPEGVSVNSNTVQTDIMYRARQKEFTTSGTDTLEGWVFYESFTPDQPYGEWSEWTETELTGDEYLEVEEQHLYRYREQEFTTSESSTMAGWTMYDSRENYSYSDWSYWDSTPVSASDSIEVATGVEYEYSMAVYHDGTFLYMDSFCNTVEDGDGYTPIPIGDVSEIYNMDTGYIYTSVITNVRTRKMYQYRTKTLSSITYYYSRWTDWSDWGTEAVSATETIEVEEKSLYRSRDIYGEVGYRFWRWSDWSDWTLKKPEETDEVGVEARMVYRYER